MVMKVEGKLFRADFEFGGNAGYTIVTPEKGWSFIPMRSDKPNEIPAPVLKSMQSQLDISGPLVNYKAKGYQAVLKGKENINGAEAYNIELTSADGKNINYYIDTSTRLLTQIIQMSEGGRNGSGQPKETITHFKDYIDVDGIQFPQTITTEGEGMGAGTMTFDKIEINVPVDENKFSKKI